LIANNESIRVAILKLAQHPAFAKLVLVLVVVWLAQRRKEMRGSRIVRALSNLVGTVPVAHAPFHIGDVASDKGNAREHGRRMNRPLTMVNNVALPIACEGFLDLTPQAKPSAAIIDWRQDVFDNS